MCTLKAARVGRELRKVQRTWGKLSVQLCKCQGTSMPVTPFPSFIWVAFSALCLPLHSLSAPDCRKPSTWSFFQQNLTKDAIFRHRSISELYIVHQLVCKEQTGREGKQTNRKEAEQRRLESHYEVLRFLVWKSVYGHNLSVYIYRYKCTHTYFPIRILIFKNLKWAPNIFHRK